MSSADRVTGARRWAQGRCHRCGWRGSVTKVRRPDRSVIGSGRAYGRLCQECLSELIDQPTREDIAAAPHDSGKISDSDSGDCSNGAGEGALGAAIDAADASPLRDPRSGNAGPMLVTC